MENLKLVLYMKLYINSEKEIEKNYINFSKTCLKTKELVDNIFEYYVVI